MTGWKLLALGCGVAILSACSSYQTPGAAANIPSLAETSIQNQLIDEPIGHLPVNLLVVRIQAPGYTSATNSGYGSGRYSVVGTQGEGAHEALARIAAEPAVASVVCLNALMLSPVLNSIRDLRVLAAKLQFDAVLVYTVDTEFTVAKEQVGPWSTISFGWLAKEQATVTSQASGMLVDVARGRIYGLLDGNARNVWEAGAFSHVKDSQVDQARLRAEQAAYGSFLDDFDRLWIDLLHKGGAEGPSVQRLPVAAIRC